MVNSLAWGFLGEVGRSRKLVSKLFELNSFTGQRRDAATIRLNGRSFGWDSAE